MPFRPKFRDVAAMLEACASGVDIRLANHSRVVKANGKCYRALPKHDDFDVSHLKKMIRHLDVDKKCANTFFKDLFSEYEVGRADAAKN